MSIKHAPTGMEYLVRSALRPTHPTPDCVSFNLGRSTPDDLDVSPFQSFQDPRESRTQHRVGAARALHDVASGPKSLPVLRTLDAEDSALPKRLPAMRLKPACTAESLVDTATSAMDRDSPKVVSFLNVSGSPTTCASGASPTPVGDGRRRLQSLDMPRVSSDPKGGCGARSPLGTSPGTEKSPTTRRARHPDGHETARAAAHAGGMALVSRHQRLNDTDMDHPEPKTGLAAVRLARWRGAGFQRTPRISAPAGWGPSGADGIEKLEPLKRMETDGTNKDKVRDKEKGVSGARRAIRNRLRAMQASASISGTTSKTSKAAEDQRQRVRRLVDKYLEAHARSHIPVGAGEVVTPKELSELRQAFLTMDVNNNGYIEQEDFDIQIRQANQLLDRSQALTTEDEFNKLVLQFRVFGFKATGSGKSTRFTGSVLVNCVKKGFKLSWKDLLKLVYNKANKEGIQRLYNVHEGPTALTSDQLHELEVMWTRWGGDATGTLSKDAFETNLKQLKMNSSEVDGICEEIKTHSNNSGAISQEAFAGWYCSDQMTPLVTKLVMNMEASELEKLWYHWDMESVGALHAVDLQMALEKLKLDSQDVSQIMDDLDVHHDGIIRVADFLAWYFADQVRG